MAFQHSIGCKQKDKQKKYILWITSSPNAKWIMKAFIGNAGCNFDGILVFDQLKKCCHLVQALWERLCKIHPLNPYIFSFQANPRHFFLHCRRPQYPTLPRMEKHVISSQAQPYEGGSNVTDPLGCGYQSYFSAGLGRGRGIKEAQVKWVEGCLEQAYEEILPLWISLYDDC